jgi:hypothetical protein
VPRGLLLFCLFCASDLPTGTSMRMSLAIDRLGLALFEHLGADGLPHTSGNSGRAAGYHVS